MKNLTQGFLLAVLSTAAAITSLNAQMVTLETTSFHDGSTQSFNKNQTLTQTFSNVVGVESMTYRFVSTNGLASNETTLEAYFYEWNPATNRTIGAAIWSPVGAQVIPVSSNPLWQSYTDINSTPYLGFDYTLTPSLSSLNPNATYAMILRASNITIGGNTSYIGLQNIPDYPSDAFGWGVGLRLNNVTNINTLATTSSQFLSGQSDYGFQQITITPVPEPQTAAAVLALVFVAGLVARRLYVKRQEAALVPVRVTAA